MPSVSLSSSSDNPRNAILAAGLPLGVANACFLHERRALPTDIVLPVVVAGLLGGFWLAYQLLRRPAAAAPLSSRLREISQAIKSGNFKGRLPADSGPTGDALNDLLALAEAINDQQKQELQTSARITRGLDVVVTNVMVADADLNIVYVNESIRQMLETAESDIRKDLPAFNAKTVVGTNIDVFHKNPAHQRGMLSRMTSTHKAALTVGGRSFSLILNPINDNAARRQGYVVECKDMTAELAAQKAEAERVAAERKLADENLRIKNALDNV